MDTVRVRTVAPPEREKLHRMKRQRTNQVNSAHARIILLSSGGVRNREIAEWVDRSPQWVRKSIHRFNAGGVGAIEWYPYWHESQPATSDNPNVICSVYSRGAEGALLAITNLGQAPQNATVGLDLDALSLSVPLSSRACMADTVAPMSRPDTVDVALSAGAFELVWVRPR